MVKERNEGPLLVPDCCCSCSCAGSRSFRLGSQHCLCHLCLKQRPEPQARVRLTCEPPEGFSTKDIEVKLLCLACRPYPFSLLHSKPLRPIVWAVGWPMPLQRRHYIDGQFDDADFKAEAWTCVSPACNNIFYTRQNLIIWGLFEMFELWL